MLQPGASGKKWGIVGHIVEFAMENDEHDENDPFRGDLLGSTSKNWQVPVCYWRV